MEIMDEQPVNVLHVINGTDTTYYSVDKQIMEHYLKSNQPDNSHTLEIILPVLAALLTLVITRLFDFWSDRRKYKTEILKETRNAKIKYLSYLNKYKISLEKPKFPDADLEDFYDWTADSVIVQNPFEEIKIQGNIVFNDNEEILNLINELYYEAEKIRNEFNFKTREHSGDALKSASIIIDNLGKIIEKMSKNLNEV
jgi:hypothetical protein